MLFFYEVLYWYLYTGFLPNPVFLSFIEDFWKKFFIRLSETIKLTIALVVLFTYGLLMTTPMEAIWNKIRPYIKENNITSYYYALRTLLILGNGKTKNKIIRNEECPHLNSYASGFFNAYPCIGKSLTLLVLYVR